MFNQYTYLYVEDDLRARRAMKVIFENVMQVDNLIIFDDSSNFMSKVNALPTIPDVFLLDIHMEPINGFDMLNLLKEESINEKARIVALTASVMNDEIERLQDAGFHAVIAKPIIVKSFPALIQKILNGDSIWHIA